MERLSTRGGGRFDAEFRLRKPAILAGYFSAHCLDEMVPDRLADRLGSMAVTTYRIPAIRSVRRLSEVRSDFYLWSDASRAQSHLRTWKFGDFLAAIGQGSPHYCMANRSKNRALRDALADAAAAPALARRLTGSARRDFFEFFIGSPATGPGLHHDGAAESFLCQLYGRKTINIYSPADGPWLYPASPLGEQNWHFSAVGDSFRASRKRFPLFSRARLQRVEMNAGDILYLPPFWYHDPAPAGLSVTMTIRRLPPTRSWGTVANRDRFIAEAAAFHRRLAALPRHARRAFADRLALDFRILADEARRPGKTGR